MKKVIELPLEKRNYKLGEVIEYKGKRFRLIAIKLSGDFDCWDCGNSSPPILTTKNTRLHCPCCGSFKVGLITLSPHKPLWIEVKQ